MMGRRFALLALLCCAFMASVYSPRAVAQAVDSVTAKTSCDAWSASRGYGACQYFAAPVVHPTLNAWCSVVNGSRVNCYTFYGAGPNFCTAGSIVPPGTNYTQSSTTGEACTSGANSCEMSFVLGGPNSGAQMLTGNACPALGTPKSGIVPPKSSETVNADGSKTFCDPISGKCVTSSAGPATAPASSSSSANNSTDTASTTHNPASSSSSTTTSTSTTTTTGDGSGSGSGNSTGVTTGTSTTKTDTPASASSTAAKCTGGACDVGLADGNMGALYQAGTDTPASVYADFKAQVSSSPIMSAATGFFDASGLGGSTCPTWHIPGNQYWGQAGFSFDFFCSAGMLALLALAGYMVLAVGAFSAFRIAIY